MTSPVFPKIMTLSSHWTSSLNYGTPSLGKPLLLFMSIANESNKPSMRLLLQPIPTLQYFQKWVCHIFVFRIMLVEVVFTFINHQFCPLILVPFPHQKWKKTVIYWRPLGFSLVIIGANFSIVVCICSSELATMTCNEGGEILSPNLTIHGRTVQRYSSKMIRLSWEEITKANN